MGLGFLFIGYLFAFGFTSGANYIVSFIGLVGAVLLFIASLKLSTYSHAFKGAKFSAIAVGASYLLNALITILNSSSIISDESVLIKLCKAAVIASVFAFNAFMYKGVADIAKIAENKLLFVSSYRNFLIMIVYYLIIALTSVFSYFSLNIAPIFSLISAIIGVIWLISSLWLTVSAYMRICLQGDEDMPEKKRR